MARSLVSRTVNPKEPAERGLDGRVIADLNDNKPAFITSSVVMPSKTSYNENLTTYTLLQELINYPPYFETSVFNASEPVIKPIQFNEEDRNTLYVDENGVIKVLNGSSFILRCKAQQPPIYNVENGRPVLLYDTVVPATIGRSDISGNITQRQLQPTSSNPQITGLLEDDLSYGWFKDDGVVDGTLIDLANSTARLSILESNRALLFENISPALAGTYYCEVANDIGSITTEQVVIEVYNPDIESKFFTNLITNANGETGVDEWSSADNEFISTKLSTAPFTEFSKPWNQDIFGYTLDMFYPRPYHINTYHIKNSELTNTLVNNGSYFTREDYKYIAKGGKSIISAEYDVDLADVQEYIQGSIFGVSGVRAIFGCYIGNAVTKFIHTIITAVSKKRNFIYNVDPANPRLSLINALMAGVPILDEVCKVYITEYDNDTPLVSKRLVDLTTGETVDTFGIEIVDTWNKLLYEYDNNGSNINLVPEKIGSGFISQGNTREEKLLVIAKDLFPSPDIVPTLGQHVKWNREVLAKLNHKTNKIKIKLEFSIKNGTPISERNANILNKSDRPIESFTWESIVKPFWFPQNDDAYVKVAGQRLGIHTFNELQSIGVVPDEIDKPEFTSYTPLLPSPRVMATGFNLVLVPIEARKPEKLYYYTKTVLEPLNNRVYPQLSSSLAKASVDLEQTLIEIQSYTGSIIAVDVLNVYNLPKKIQPSNNSYFYNLNKPEDLELEVFENIKAQGGVASTITVATYKYQNNDDYQTPVPVETISLLYDQNTSLRDWKQVSMASELTYNVAGLYFGVVETPYVIYNPSAESIQEATIPQIPGQLKSNLIKFVDNPIITSIPPDFVKEEIDNITDYISNIGFDLVLKYEPYGVIPTSQGGTLGPTQRFNAWKQPTPAYIQTSTGRIFDEVPEVSYDYKLFRNVGDGELNKHSGRQVLFYDEDLMNESIINKKPTYLAKTIYNGDGTYLEVPNEVEQLPYIPWKANILGSLENLISNTGYAYEDPITQVQQNIIQNALFSAPQERQTVITKRSDFKFEGDLLTQTYTINLTGYQQANQEGNARGRIARLAEQALASAYSELRSLYGENGKYGTWQEKYPTGIKESVRYVVKDLRAGTEYYLDTTDVRDIFEIFINGLESGFYVLGAEATITAVAGTWDRVSLTNVNPKKNKYTPAAIVFPKSKRIYYFVYNYIDNYLEEE